MKKKLTFEEFQSEVAKLMKQQYGLDRNDFDDDGEQTKNSFKGKESPQEFVDWYAQRYDMDRIDLGPYGINLKPFIKK